MLKRIKGLMESEERILALIEHSKKASNVAEESGKAVRDLRDDMNGFRSDLSSLKMTGMEVSDSLKKDLTSFKELKDTLKSEITDFKLLKTALKKKLVEELATEFRNELSVHGERLKTDVRSYNDLKDELMNIKNKLVDVETELTKFNSISKKIKETDFELTNYIKKITQMDNEKLHLMKKVDDLQRLIAKERRSRR